MKDVSQLILKLKVELGKTEKEEGFKFAINEIAQFYMDSFRLSNEEIALLLINREKTVLSFAHPPYLVNAGMIPINLSEAIASRVFRTGKGFIDNNLQQQRHLFIFESIKTPDNKILPIWKMIGARIFAGESAIGVIEVSKRSTDFTEAGEDFTISDLQFLEDSIKNIAPVLMEVLPKNFRGKFK
jgi:hypothetical protein